jgi:hypothetical protein
MQYVEDLAVAMQVASLCYEFDTQIAQNGDRLTVNEGIRSRERQDYLYDLYLHHGGALAANPYSSTHDHTRGSALDFGITSRSGVNRALTPTEFDWLHTRAPLRGIRWTGASFWRVEPWHHNGGYLASLPPLPDVNLPGDPLRNALPAENTKTPVGDIVTSLIIHIDNRKGAYDSYLVNADTMRAMHITSGTQENFWKGKGVPVVSGNQPPAVINNFEKVGK